MKLYVNRRYSSSHAGPFKAGDIIEVHDALGEFLMRDGEGIFEPISEAGIGGKAVPPPSTPVPDLSAMSTETATGLVAPDRRARGGKVRTKK